MNRIQIFSVLTILLVSVGCSSGGSPVTPQDNPQTVLQSIEAQSNREILGVWEINIDPVGQTFEVVPDRKVGSHFNVVRMLEVDPCTDCLTINNLNWLPDNVIKADFNLEHPYPEYIRLTGFDVRGILVTDGDTLFPGSDRLLSLDGSNPTLLTPDGYTSLFNPVEFPAGGASFPVLEYIPGKFSSGDTFTATLNPFMVFGKDNPRRMLSPGAIETANISVKAPSRPISFGYVVDVSWIKVAGEIIDPVTDFPPDANCLEPYMLDFRMTGLLTSDPGDSTGVQVEVFDHQGLDTISSVSIECPSLFLGEIFLDYSSQAGDDSWLFDGRITNEINADIGSYPLLVNAMSMESDSNLGALAAYQIKNVNVIPPGNGNLIWAKKAGNRWDVGYGITTLSDDSTVVIGRVYLTQHEFGKIFVARFSPEGDLVWGKWAGGDGNDDGYGITTLSDDSVVVTGRFSEDAIFGAGEANETLLESYGYYDNDDIFVARYNPDGTLAWVRHAGGFYKDSGNAITSLSDDSTVITGAFVRTATFGEGEANETVLESAGYEDIFVARFYPGGNLAWAKRVGSTSHDYGTGITTLSDDQTVVTGRLSGPVTFGEGEANETVLEGSAFFLAWYNPDGTFAFVKHTTGAGYVECLDITTLSNDSIAVTGSVDGTPIFGEGEPDETELEHSYNDIFVARYNPDGTVAWAKKADGRGWEDGLGITGLSDDSTIVTGYFTYEVDFGVGEPNETRLEAYGDEDIFVARYKPDGTLDWVKRAGGDGYLSIDHRGNGITSLSDDSSVVTGKFMDDVVFGEGEPNETFLEDGGIFVARYAP